MKKTKWEGNPLKYHDPHLNTTTTCGPDFAFQGSEFGNDSNGSYEITLIKLDSPEKEMIFLHITRYGDGDIRLREGWLSLFSDEGEIKLTPYHGDTGLFTGEKIMYLIDQKTLTGLCEASTLRFDLCTAGECIVRGGDFSDLIIYSKAFYHTFIDQTMYPDAIEQWNEMVENEEAERKAKKSGENKSVLGSIGKFLLSIIGGIVYLNIELIRHIIKEK